MKIHERMWRRKLAAICVGGLLALIALAISPAMSLAGTLECSNITGSGSTLQTLLQQTLAKEARIHDLTGCISIPEIKYNEPTGTGSGAGLEEFGLQGGATLKPTLSANGTTLDEYIDSDDPPTEHEIQEGRTAGGSNPITVPIAAAPIAIIIHLPEGCTVTGGPLRLTIAELYLVWTGQMSWEQFLHQLGWIFSGKCAGSPIREVRFDGSGTSFAFKQFLSQIKAKPWQEFAKDEAKWPEGTQAKTLHFGTQKGTQEENHGSKGEARAVRETPGSIGYVNTGDAANGNEIGPWKETNQNKVFWPQVQNNGEAQEIKSAEPAKELESGRFVGNCPKQFKLTGTKFKGRAESQPPQWSGIELPNPKSEGAYPICTLTYDIGWESYSTEPAKKQYEKGQTPTGAKNTVKEYFRYLLGTGANEGQTRIKEGIPEYFAPLPEEILEIAKKGVENELAKS